MTREVLGEPLRDAGPGGAPPRSPRGARES
jgi:hypothetical protein